MTLPSRPAPHSLPARLLVAAGATLGVIALTLAPRRFVAPARGVFMEAVAPFFTDWSYGEIESFLNVLLFVPLGAALAILLGRWWLWSLPLGLGLSLAVEVLQTRVPGRVPDLHDVLWNTVGALAGTITVACVRWVAHRRRG